MTRTCGECGVDISTLHGNARFCGNECLIVRRRKRQKVWADSNSTAKRASQRAWRERNPEKAVSWAPGTRERLVERNRRWAWDYKRERGCAGLLDAPCPFGAPADPRVLDFDHIRDKTENLSALIQDAVPITRLEEEAAKCVIRCRNCHQMVTAERANTYLHRFYQEANQ